MFAMDIDTTEHLHNELSEHTDNAYVVHSQVTSSNTKKDRIVNRRIQKFGDANHGVLIAPKLLDEGTDVPDAEVRIETSERHKCSRTVPIRAVRQRQYGYPEREAHSASGANWSSRNPRIWSVTRS